MVGQQYNRRRGVHQNVMQKLSQQMKMPQAQGSAVWKFLLFERVVTTTRGHGHTATLPSIMSTGGPSNTNQLGLDQSTTAQGTAGGNHPGMGGPPNTNQLGIDQTGGQNSAGTQSFNSGTGQGTTGVSGTTL